MTYKHQAADLVNSSDGVLDQTEFIDKLAVLLTEAHASGRRVALFEAADKIEAKAKRLEDSAQLVGMISIIGAGCQIAIDLIRGLIEKETLSDKAQGD